MGRPAASKRSGTPLTPEKIDASKKINAYRRNESMKDFAHAIKKFVVVAMLIVIPILYVMFLWANWGTPSTRNEWIRQGIGGALAFVLGKADIKIAGGEESE